MKGGDQSEDVYTITYNGVLISKMQFNLIKLQKHVYLSDINYFKKALLSIPMLNPYLCYSKPCYMEAAL